MPRQEMREEKIKPSFEDSEASVQRRGSVSEEGPYEHITDFQSKPASEDLENDFPTHQLSPSLAFCITHGICYCF